MSFLTKIAPIVAVLSFILALIAYFFPNSADFVSTALPMVSSFIDNITSGLGPASGLGPIISGILFYVAIFVIILVLAGILYFLYIYLDDEFIFKFKGISILKGGISEFDRDLIESVNFGKSSDSLITRIKEKSDMIRHIAKSKYDSNLLQSSYLRFINPKEQYDKDLISIQQLEEFRISFVKTLISEKAFRKSLKNLYIMLYLLD